MGFPVYAVSWTLLHAEYAYNYEDGWFQFTTEIPGK